MSRPWTELASRTTRRRRAPRGRTRSSCSVPHHGEPPAAFGTGAPSPGIKQGCGSKHAAPCTGAHNGAFGPSPLPPSFTDGQTSVRGACGVSGGGPLRAPTMSFLNSTEDSTDDSEREDEEYEVVRAHYAALVQRALLQAGPDLDALPVVNDEPWQQWSGNGGGVGGASAPYGPPRRLFFCGFGPTLTPTHIYEFLLQFGPIELFRLYIDPSTNLSLRAAGVVYLSAADAARALEAAADGMVYLADVWAPEAQMHADPLGEIAKTAFEAHTHAQVPPLLPPPTDARGGLGGYPRHAADQPPTPSSQARGAAPSYGRSKGQGGGVGSGEQQPASSGLQAVPLTAELERATQLFVRGIHPNTTQPAVRKAFGVFGPVHDMLGMPPCRHHRASLRCTVCHCARAHDRATRPPPCPRLGLLDVACLEAFVAAGHRRCALPSPRALASSLKSHRHSPLIFHPPHLPHPRPAQSSRPACWLPLAVPLALLHVLLPRVCCSPSVLAHRPRAPRRSASPLPLRHPRPRHHPLRRRCRRPRGRAGRQQPRRLVAATCAGSPRPPSARHSAQRLSRPGWVGRKGCRAWCPGRRRLQRRGCITAGATAATAATASAAALPIVDRGAAAPAPDRSARPAREQHSAC